MPQLRISPFVFARNDSGDRHRQIIPQDRNEALRLSEAVSSLNPSSLCLTRFLLLVYCGLGGVKDSRLRTVTLAACHALSNKLESLLMSFSPTIFLILDPVIALVSKT